MKRNSSLSKILFILLASLFVLACEFLAAGTAVPVPTNLIAPTNPPQPTDLPTATDTPPTEVIDLAATQRADELNSLLQTFEDKGYLTTIDGEVTELAPFKEEWAQIGYFSWWTYDVITTPEFVFKAHFDWSTASSTPDATGCGVLFGIQENGDYYAVFLDNKQIYFFMNRGQLYTVGKTSGKGKTSFDNPAESDFVLAVSNKKAYVSVDGDVTVYTLSQDQTAAGTIGLSLMSGTNKDYGTRCEATDMVVWSAK